MSKQAYGLEFKDEATPLDIEFTMIRAGGYVEKNGQKFGQGLFHHYREAQTLIWPHLCHHRWSDLILKTILEERITVVQGCHDSSKTNSIVRFALVDYWAFPENTLIIMSSTSLQGADMRVFGQIKKLWTQGKKRWDWLPGNVVDAEKAIYTDALDRLGDVRDKTKGFVCIATEDSEVNEFAGLQRFIGVKQERRRLLGNELQFIGVSYLKALTNLDQGDFKGVFDGNPLGQKALDVIAEPEGGWESIPEPEKTTTWRNKYDGITVNLVGTDSPNFDPDRPRNYPFLLQQEDIDRVIKRCGIDSIDYYSQIKGVRKAQLNAHLVLTAAMCRAHRAFEPCVWGHHPFTKVLGVDAGFGGDDCEISYGRFGTETSGQNVIQFSKTETIAIKLKTTESPEDQIAKGVKDFCDANDIPYQNVFVEAGMRATLAMSFAREMGAVVNMVLAGGPATDRAVSADLFIEDEKTGQRRLKMCKEHYSKFITEMWFQVREVVESDQAREMHEDAITEFSKREWSWAPGNRYELESKPDFKARNGFSPNKADSYSIMVEGARRLGFIIARMKSGPGQTTAGEDWLGSLVRDHRKALSQTTLKYS